MDLERMESAVVGALFGGGGALGNDKETKGGGHLRTLNEDIKTTAIKTVDMHERSIFAALPNRFGKRLMLQFNFEFQANVL